MQAATKPSRKKYAGNMLPAAHRRLETIRIGYVPLVDAAPLLVAESLGLFQDAGLRVRLDRELGWGSIREKIVYGELEAAHAPGGLLCSILCGTHSRPRAVSTDLILNLQGNAITLSRRLWQKGVRDSQTLRLMVRSEAPRKLVFAVVSPFSSHIHLLRKWLRQAGVDPDRDVRIAVLPPPLVGEHMKEGQIDGFCVGEPWNSAAALAGEGWIAATSATLEPGHPEKVLLVNEGLALERADEYAALRDALYKACTFCDSADGRKEVLELLHSRRIFSVSREVLSNSLIGPFQMGADQPAQTAPFILFAKSEANRATRDRALWIVESLIEAGTASLDARQRRMCLDAFHDKHIAEPKRKTKL